MSGFEAPHLPAPRLDAILGRRAPNLSMHQLRRAEREGGPSLDPNTSAYAALEPHLSRVRPRDSVAIGVGSRGIKAIGPVVAGMVRAVRQRGGEPFILPAMGSHGGASAEGQRQTLADLGVSEDLVGAPVRATMETVPLGMADDVDIAVDAYAAKADHILLVNRLKSHTSFSGEIESGLAKMLAIGFGKQHGAEELHRRGPVYIERRIRIAAASIARQLPVIGGLALVEGLEKGLVVVQFVSADGIGGAREAELLLVAKGHEARLPFDQIDVLVVDSMGKDFSGTGMDTNVIGRRMVRSMPELATPRITNIVCLDISGASHGNAVGIGLADFVTSQALRAFDPVATYANTLTAGSQGLQRAQIPIVLADEVDAVSAAMLTSDVGSLEQVRLARIRNTLHLDEIMVSDALLDGATGSYDRQATIPLFGSGGRLSTW